MAEGKRVVVTGATGLIGKRLCAALIARGDQVVVFSRNPQAAQASVAGAAEYVAWDASEHGAWAEAINGSDAVINLAGASVNGARWTDEYKKTLYNSRVIGTRGIVKAIAAAEQPPAVLINGSAVGYYGFRDDTPLDESAKPGNDFLARLCVDWEAEAAKAESANVRTVLLRTGIVLSTEEGALPQLMLPFKLFAGGPVLPGTQWFSWIHIDDEVGLIVFALDDERVRGPLNATAPEPLTNRDFTATLGRTMKRPSWLPVPGFGLSAAFGELGSSLTEGQRVIPAKALELGYQFKYPTAQAALQQLIGAA
jgi:uncharacterized protein